MTLNTAERDGMVLVGKSVKDGKSFKESKSDKYEYLTLKYANRHGLVTGATGTGKTVTLQTLAEGLSSQGISVFAADIKGDLSGLSMMGDSKDIFVKRSAQLGLTYSPNQFPVVFWDLFGQQGHPVRTTISEMGPLLLARLLQLNDTQEGVLNILFNYADKNGLLLLDIKDLRSLLAEFGSNKDLQQEVQSTYGNISSASIGAIQRQLLVLENQGANQFFGEPALDIQDFLRKSPDGRGVINILSADKLMQSPMLYATFLLWLLSELFQVLPEVGDLPQPKLVFFFDEAHLLFNDAPKPLLNAVEQVVRLIRSKGVGIYFVTQNPLDVPDTVLGQLSNRVQHALRAFTPRDQKAVQAAASTFRQNPEFNTADTITQLGVGEALISMLLPDGTPEMVSRSYIKPPSARVGPVNPQERAAIMANSGLGGKYNTLVDRESAYETLLKRHEPQQAEGGIGGMLGGLFGSAVASSKSKRAAPASMAEKMVTSAARSVASSVGRQIGSAIIRGVFGAIFKR